MSADTAYALTDAASSATSVFHACVSSIVNTTPVSGERMTPPTTAARPAIAQKPANTGGSRCPSSAPSAPPIMNTGARTPPDVPEPSDSDQISVLTTRMPTISDRPARPASSWPITSYPTPSARGSARPPMPMIAPPIAGHHIQCSGSLANASSDLYTSAVAPTASSPPVRPGTSASATAPVPGAVAPGTGKMAALPSSAHRQTVAAVTAADTGIMLRGRHSNSSSSTASSTEASGALNVAAMPPAAPATSRVFLSSADSSRNCARIEPTAPPVMMIGPSAPNGPPVPIEIAAETGLSTATRGATRLPPVRIASIASGIPCPRIFSLPYRAMTPTTRPPATGASRISHAGWCPAPGAASVTDSRW
jgi:hypothetical protein